MILLILACKLLKTTSVSKNSFKAELPIFTCVLWCKTKTHIEIQMKRAKENWSVNVLDAAVCLHWMERVETA